MFLFLLHVRSGFVNINSSRLRNSGVIGYGWSPKANSSDPRYAYSFSFYATVVYPSGDDDRWHGFPLRCLARQ